jgi:hypothetical protein
MKRIISIAVICLLSAQQASAARLPDEESRAAFRYAVEEYQIFVVPRCAPKEVETYVAARKDRDTSFIKSLRKANLLADYNKAVADRAKRDANTVFHCFGPPPPPPPPPGTPAPQPIAAEKPVDSLAEHFAAGDRQFAVMKRLRDAAVSGLDK